jgi:glycosyltransferase involved in cell wall biosynthesis
MPENTLALLVPAYNAAAFLPRLLRSAAVQTRPFDEVWVYDDCSTDNTGDVARSFGARVVTGDINRGCSYGKNVLASKTSCKWVHFHDADDELLPGFVEKAHDWMAQDEHDVILFGFESWDGQRRAGIRNFARSELEHDAIRYSIRNQINPFCGLYRRAAFLEAGGYDLDPQVLYNEDVAFHIRLAIAGLRFSSDDDVLVINHLQRQSMSQSNLAKCVAAQYHVMRKTAESYVGLRYAPEISARLWNIAACAAAYLDWQTADRAAVLAMELAGANTSESHAAFRLLCQLSPRLALRVREKLIRLLKPHLRAAYPGPARARREVAVAP